MTYSRLFACSWKNTLARDELDHSYGLISEEEHEESLTEFAAFRERLTAFGTGERGEIGAAHVDRYAGRSHRRPTVSRTQEGIGIVVAPEQYRPLSLKDAKLWTYLA